MRNPGIGTGPATGSTAPAPISRDDYTPPPADAPPPDFVPQFDSGVVPDNAMVDNWSAPTIYDDDLMRIEYVADVAANNDAVETFLNGLGDYGAPDGRDGNKWIWLAPPSTGLLDIIHNMAGGEVGYSARWRMRFRIPSAGGTTGIPDTRTEGNDLVYDGPVLTHQEFEDLGARIGTINGYQPTAQPG